MEFPNVTNSTEVGMLMDEGLGLKNIIVVCVMTVLMLFICSGNAFVIIIVAKSRALQTITSACIINLAFADFLVGLHAIPHIIYELDPRLVDYYEVCCLRMSTIICMTFVSVASLTAISVDRCLGILKPLHQRHIITPVRIKLIIIATWIFGLANAIPLVSGLIIWQPGKICLVLYVVPDTYLHCITSEVYFFTILLIIIYAITLNAIRKHRLRVQAHKSATQSTEKAFVENARLAKAFAMVVGVFILSWLPFTILAEVSHRLEDEYLQGSTFKLIYKITVALVYMNSAANPVIYALRISSFQKAVKENLHCHCCGHGDKLDSSTGCQQQRGKGDDNGPKSESQTVSSSSPL